MRFLRKVSRSCNFARIAACLIRPTSDQAGKYAFGSESMSITTNQRDVLQHESFGSSFALSGSNQAREGRLVDALAVRGDEGRDTLR